MQNLEQERARLEAWASVNISRYGFKRLSNGEYVSAATQLAWQAWQARCPEGWQVVPKRPSGKMYTAMKDPNHQGGVDFEALLKWEAVLAAAPQPGEES